MLENIIVALIVLVALVYGATRIRATFLGGGCSGCGGSCAKTRDNAKIIKPFDAGVNENTCGSDFKCSSKKKI